MVGAASTEAGAAGTGKGAVTNTGTVGAVTGTVTVTETSATGSEPEAGQTETESGTAGDASAMTRTDEAEGSEDISFAGTGAETEVPPACEHFLAIWPG